MKNIFKYAICTAVAILGLATSCDILDIKNLENYDEAMVWGDEKLATAYVNNLYAEGFGNWSAGADNNSDIVSGVVWKSDFITESGSNYKYWYYTTIRNINVALESLENGTLDEACKKELSSQAYFMRAYMYYLMVRAHGGVPYIKKPQKSDDPDLYVKRNSTAECFQFIVEDLDKAIAGLPEIARAKSYGRIDQCFAKAFKAKVLLLKASPQFNPKNPYGNKWYADAYTAAKDAYDHCIAQGIELTKNYEDIWKVEPSAEAIFTVINSNPNKNCYWEPAIRPSSMSRGVNYNNPTWEFVKMFPMADGKAYDDPSGKYALADEEALKQSFWQNRDPRFSEVIMWNGKLYPVADKAAVQGYRQYNALGLCNGDDQYGINPAAGINAVNNDNYTGFYIVKAAQLDITQANILTNDVDYIVMRLPELMFILAEAATETGHLDVAKDMLRQIRSRAGIEEGDGDYGMDLSSKESIREAILLERALELCFEGHRFWDLRRTRNMMRLNGLQKHGLEAIAIEADGTEMDMAKAKSLADKYELKPENFKYVERVTPYTPAAEKTHVLDEKFYFFPIMTQYLNENENLEQNIDWGGTFNPTME